MCIQAQISSLFPENYKVIRVIRSDSCIHYVIVQEHWCTSVL